MTDDDFTVLPPGTRRLELIIHSDEEIDGYLSEAQRLLDVHEIPDEERPQLRLLLIQLLGARQVQLIETMPRQQQQGSGLMIPGMPLVR